jgi:TonB-dependent receptor
VGTAGYARRYDHRDERQRYFTGQEIRYDYDVDRSTQSATGGGKLGLSYRLTPSNSLHMRGVYTRNQDDEVRRYVGFASDRGRNQQGARLMYTERSLWTGSLEGNHELKGLAGSKFDWRASLSGATRKQPDRRESIYEQVFRDDPNTGEPIPTWVARSTADGITRESQDLDEQGNGFDGSWATPFRAFGGGGKLTAGYGYQFKEREALLRRFSFQPPTNRSTAAPPESLFDDPSWTGNSTGAQLVETTRDDDNYRGFQKQVAGYLSAEVPMGARVRAILGLRVERGVQEVTSYSLLPWGKVTAVGEIDETDWLPSANLVWSPGDNLNVRAAASRTISRPDLRELSPTNAIEYQGGLRTRGNPDLDRARIENYDFRVETFPGLSEVLAAGVYYKQLYDPIEQVIRGGDEPYLEPRNSVGGYNTGLELELRANLGRLIEPLDRFFVNANFSTIRSEIETDPGVTLLGSTRHPLQGQADRLFNVGLGYQTAGGGVDVSLLYNYVGTRLEALGVLPLPDMYAQPLSSFDVAANLRLAPYMRLKLAGKNLNTPVVRTLQGEEEVLRYLNNASFQVTLNVGL